MAQVVLSPLIKSMSGTIAKKRLPDGTVITYVVTKKNRLYIHTTKPRSKPLTMREMNLRNRFGVIASAVKQVKQQVRLPSGQETTKKLWSTLGQLYELMVQNSQVVTPAKLADSYCALLV